MSNNEHTNWYANVFKNWQVKLLGPKPSNDMLAQIHGLGARPGKQALANAMSLRECGVTGAQIMIACGAPQLNRMRGFITDSLLKRVAVSPSPEGHKVYKCELTPKGIKRIEAAEKRSAALEAAGKADPVEKPVKAKKAAKAVGKAKGKAKAKKAAKVQPAETPTSEADKASVGMSPKRQADTDALQTIIDSAVNDGVISDAE